MNIILLSGGSGKRLWPLSNETRSKQFLKLLKDPQGNSESMIQRVYRQIRESSLESNILVATGKSQIYSIKSQIGNKVDVVLEPERRDTFPAIILSCAYLAYEKGLSEDEAVIVMPVDPYADRGYFESLKKMEEMINEGIANIVLMGIKPTYPSAKYGYIIPNRDGNVERFQEKPSEEYAQKLIQEGAMWNGGVFAFKLNYILNIAKKYADFSSFEEIKDKYSDLPKISFDYEVVEKEKSIGMVVYAGIWKDLGTWNTLTEVMESGTLGNVILAETCHNTNVINELSIPITVLGINNAVIAASSDGILVTDKHESSYLKPYVENINQRPMYEEREWGEYKVLDYVAYGDGTSSLTKSIFIKAGKSISYQSHAIRDEIWTIVDGTGDFLIDGHVRNVRRGDVANIAKGQKHAIRATTDLRLIEVQIGVELVETDIERYDWKW
ncbi:MAG TPA: sugar phosphate nucleotidyltransferase [Sedimentibacter sp.]|jgi:mannose-1-phosphate guanylyltransferase|nr:cupin domain-containing protein [Sedimentibacter sp.]HOK49817.1 sugar phosphate nucleotidyltransferase [Sedimentibacter sp.]HOW23455.1 sugar phosphate nucleotidyltransferase [Sedimentibacter sp.]